MDPLEQIALAAQAIASAVRTGARRPQWVPWLSMFGLQAVVVLALWGFAHPALSVVALPLLRAVAGSQSLHYPEAPLAVPGALLRIDAGVGWLLAPLVFGWSAMLFATGLAGGRARAGEAWGATLSRAPRLLAVGIPLALAQTASAGMAMGALDTLGKRPLASLASFAMACVAETVVIALAACALPWLVVSAERLSLLPEELGRALRRAGVALVATSVALGAAATVGRLVVARGLADFAAAVPDLAIAKALIVALVAAAGGLIFCGASVFIHAMTQESEA